MIARIWRGVVRREDGDAYADYIRETGFSAYAKTAGNRGAWLLRRHTDERTEFITFSLWESLASVRAFAGDDIDTAVYYPEDGRYLVERDATVAHFEVADQVSPEGIEQ
jgi:heme-degrading monooxygenase HmoA